MGAMPAESRPATRGQRAAWRRCADEYYRTGELARYFTARAVSLGDWLLAGSGRTALCRSKSISAVGAREYASRLARFTTTPLKEDIRHAALAASRCKLRRRFKMPPLPNRKRASQPERIGLMVFATPEDDDKKINS